MRIALFTNEYPPNVYGGAGVHVEYMARELARVDGGAHDVQVLSFGTQREERGNLHVTGVAPTASLPVQDPRHARLLDALLRDLAMVGAVKAPDIVHCHTWYAQLAGCLARPLTGAKLVLTTHSLEPHRPWKVEQLGTGYNATVWIEQTAYGNADGVVAVSQSMKRDVQELYGVAPDKVRVIHNGIDPDEYAPRTDPATLRRLGVDPDVPIVLFVGRITRQKGILHLVRAIPKLHPGVQVVLCAGAPDTPQIGAEMTALVDETRHATTTPVVWIPEMLPKQDVIALYAHAAVFVCPSVYEPFGIINLEAMACETPVVASAVGGIPEIVVPGETGLLVPLDAEGDGSAEPKDPAAFSQALADAVNELIDDPARRERMGRAARERVLAEFSWRAIAEQTVRFYQELLGS
ncbi:glycogen synthase [Gemmatirosa kalamazoonensis]|uniref:Glycogen synthase n=1 Tax=Gemmatirosa kalamazoonensis TaxID=861299 RepID=W0RCV0_9BACT|nr:glycogen synthase [Gemmatirosa kalamazoonensis]AHG88949.1 glycogen synthase [Gemmatirosa kalamazoonensis]